MSFQRIFVLSVALFGLAVLPATAQESEVPDNPDPEVAEQLKQFNSAIADRKGTRDNEASNLIDKFLVGYDKMHPKDQAAVCKAMQLCLAGGKVKRDPEHTTLFVGCAEALGRMGSDGAKILTQAFKATKFKGEEWVSVRAVIVNNVGRAKDVKQVDWLLDRATRDPSDPIMKAAGQTLGNYEEAPLAVRKEIAKELIKKLSEVYGKARASLDPGNAQVKRSKDTLNAIQTEWNQTLSQLTKQAFNSPPDWQRFWNKSKDKDWDKP